MKLKLTWLEAFLLVTPFLLVACYWKDLPARVPVHWNLHNEIDGWTSKSSGLLILPLLNLGVIGLLHLLPRLDPKLRRRGDEQTRMPAVLAILRVTLAAFGLAIFCTQFFAALGRNVPTDRIVLSGTLLLCAVVGNYSSALRPNYFVGIRTPWTLENPDTWRATHRLGGRLMFFGSLVLLVLQFFLSATTFMIVFVTAILSLVVWAFWYSWHHFHALPAAAQ